MYIQLVWWWLWKRRKDAFDVTYPCKMFDQFCAMHKMNVIFIHP